MFSINRLQSSFVPRLVGPPGVVFFGLPGPISPSAHHVSNLPKTNIMNAITARLNRTMLLPDFDLNRKVHICSLIELVAMDLPRYLK